MRKHRDSETLELECCAAEPLLEAYVDGELAGSERAALETHLERCPGCAEELELARRIGSELRSLPRMACPPAVTRAVFEHAAARRPLGERLRGFWSDRRVWQPAVAFVLLAAVAVAYWREAGAPSPAPPPPAPAAYSEAEIAQAEAEVKLALAYIGEISDRARETIGVEVGDRLVEPFSRSIAGALFPESPPDEAQDAAQGGGDERNVS